MIIIISSIDIRSLVFEKQTTLYDRPNCYCSFLLWFNIGHSGSSLQPPHLTILLCRNYYYLHITLSTYICTSTLFTCYPFHSIYRYQIIDVVKLIFFNVLCDFNSIARSRTLIYITSKYFLPSYY